MILPSQPGQHYHSERIDYFYTDPKDSRITKPVFNRTVTLKDSFAKSK